MNVTYISWIRTQGHGCIPKHTNYYTRRCIERRSIRQSKAKSLFLSKGGGEKEEVRGVSSVEELQAIKGEERGRRKRG